MNILNKGINIQITSSMNELSEMQSSKILEK